MLTYFLFLLTYSISARDLGPYVPSPRAACPLTLIKIAWKYPLDDTDIKIILRGDNNAKIGAVMGTNALSYLAGAVHLSGRVKADLWERFSRTIPGLAEESFISEKKTLNDKNVAAFVGDTGELVVYDLE